MLFRETIDWDCALLLLLPFDWLADIDLGVACSSQSDGDICVSQKRARKSSDGSICAAGSLLIGSSRPRDHIIAAQISLPFGREREREREKTERGWKCDQCNLVCIDRIVSSNSAKENMAFKRPKSKLAQTPLRAAELLCQNRRPNQWRKIIIQVY